MRLAIADPPYPPHRALRRDRPEGNQRVTVRSRSRRWYGDGPHSADMPRADFHPAAGDWDSRDRHQELLAHLMENYDGWAIATSPDGLDAYTPFPLMARIAVWHKPNSIPGGHRLKSCWEPVLVGPPEARANRVGGIVPDVLVAGTPGAKFAGAKPTPWTHWVLDMLGYDPATDTVDDLFPGSGLVGRAIRTYNPREVLT